MKVSLPLSILPSLGFFLFFFFVLHLMPYLCFIFIHFTFFSLLLIPSLYSWLTSGQFGFSLLFPALFCCSAQSSPSYPPCLLQLPEIISRLTPFPWCALKWRHNSLPLRVGFALFLCTWMGVGEGEGGLGKPQMLREPYSNLISHCWGWKDLTQHSVRGDGKKQEERKGKRGWEWEE